MRPKRRGRLLPLMPDRRRVRDSVDEELEHHLDLLAAELVAKGVPPVEAREQALAEFGDLDRTRRYCTDQSMKTTRGRAMMSRIDETVQDLKYGCRALARNPGYSLVIALTLAIGIGANVSIFSLLNPYLMRPLPFDAPDELVQLGQTDPVQGFDARHSLHQLRDYQEQSRAFEALGAYYYGAANLTGDEGAERVVIAYVTDEMLGLLGVDAAMGRTFARGEQGPGADLVILDHGLWVRRYGADSGVVGRSVRVDGAPRTVVGVMPPDFSFPFNEVKLWAPMPETLASGDRSNNYALVVGRLAEGWQREQAVAELNRIHSGLAALYPTADGRYTQITATPIREALNFAWDGMRWGSAILGVAVGFLLLIACVNVAGLMLARAADRRREVAIRAAIGAGRMRIVRQLLVESLILSLLGGTVGVLAASLLVGTAGTTLPDAIFRVGDPSIDRNVLLFSLAVTLVTPLLFGLVPALRTARTDLVGSLKTGGALDTPRALAGRRALVVTQIAFAMVLVAATGLMVRSFMAMTAKDLGFDPSRSLAVELRPGEADYPGREDVEAYYERALEQVGSVSGVRSVATVVPLPMNHELLNTGFANAARQPDRDQDWPRAMYFRASPGYFDAMDIQVRSGRVFDDSDGADSGPVIIVSESVAREHWPGQDPLGRTILLGSVESSTEATIVGVVEDVEEEGFEVVYGAQLYRPAAQGYTRSRYVVVGVDQAAVDVAGPVADAFRQAGPAVPVLVRSMQDVVDENSMPWSIPSLLLGVFGLIALGLASLGIYGLISYSVAQRRAELGIRLALGASGRQVGRGVLAEAGRLAAWGLMLGTILALAAGQVLAGRLFGVGPMDPVTYVGAALLFGVVSLVAAARPAAAAARTDPQRILREG